MLEKGGTEAGGMIGKGRKLGSRIVERHRRKQERKGSNVRKRRKWSCRVERRK